MPRPNFIFRITVSLVSASLAWWIGFALMYAIAALIGSALSVEENTYQFIRGSAALGGGIIAASKAFSWTYRHDKWKRLIT